jgi:hypothetical protein
MNPGAPQVRILQVRANLRGAIEEMPVVNDIRLVFEDPAQVAGAGG